MDGLREDIVRVLKEHPDLCYEGFGLGPFGGKGRSPKERRVLLREQREQLLQPVGLEEIGAAIRFLDVAGRRKTVNTRHSSYGWKHVAERWAHRYISNGAFIAAALARGYAVEPFRERLNAYISIPEAASGLKPPSLHGSA